THFNILEKNFRQSIDLQSRASLKRATRIIRRCFRHYTRGSSTIYANAPNRFTNALSFVFILVPHHKAVQGLLAAAQAGNAPFPCPTPEDFTRQWYRTIFNTQSVVGQHYCPP
ncbi:Hypothetical predicted protein, partial [Paramuricea clavata]